MSVFDVDYNDLVVQLLPVKRRKAKRIAWLRALVSPLVDLWVRFMANRRANLYLMAHGSQVCFLEAVLNDTFDSVLRRIFIIDAVYIDPVYTYLDTEEKPVFLDLDSEVGTLVIPDPDPVPLYMDVEEYAGDGPSFKVKVPVVVPFDMARLRALVDRDKLVGKSYSVVTF